MARVNRTKIKFMPPKSPTAKQTPVAALSFEQALEELDQLVRSMESGQLTLDDALAAYQRGAALARYCQDKLAGAEQQIKVLDAQGLRPLEPSELKGSS